jgi:hypothetical protein
MLPLDGETMLDDGGSVGVCPKAIPGRRTPKTVTLRTVREVFTARFDAKAGTKGSLHSKFILGKAANKFVASASK